MPLPAMMTYFGLSPLPSYSNYHESDDEEMDFNHAKKQKKKHHRKNKHTPSDIIKKHSESHKVKKPKSPVAASEFFLQKLPIELQEMVWDEAIERPACHHFRLRNADVDNYRKWTIHISALPPSQDASIYRDWKPLYSSKLHTRLLQQVCHRNLGHLQPITLRQPRPRNPVYRTTAAISPRNDLVVLHFDRFQGDPEDMEFFWHEHNPGRYNALKRVEVFGRLKHFRKVAIHYSHRHNNALQEPGPFYCRCPRTNTNCSNFKACPLGLASFLDFFKRLEEFYFILDPTIKGGKRFVTEYKDMIMQQGMQGICASKKDNAKTVEKIDIVRFVDREHEYLLHTHPRFMKKMDHESPFIGDCSPRSCLISAKKIFTSQTGDEPFQKSLEKRQRVKFGLLIPYHRQPKNISE